MTKEQLLEQSKPILFNTEMVQVILDERKTTTRRLIKQPYFVDGDEEDPGTLQVLRTAPKGSWLYRQIGSMPYPEKPYQMGTFLYVRETWAFMECISCHGSYRRPENAPPCYDTQAVEYDDGDSISDGCFIYRAGCRTPERIMWHPSIHMPKEAARIFLRVKDIQLEKLQDIKKGTDPFQHIRNIEAEGLQLQQVLENYSILMDEWIKLWNSTIPKAEQNSYSWEANPWVWVIEFERVIPE